MTIKKLMKETRELKIYKKQDKVYKKKEMIFQLMIRFKISKL
jgi:hypothetical protein